VVKEAVESTLLKESFDEARVQLLIDLVCERVIKGLTTLALPMKYVGACGGRG
jgi:hypothetical protein